MRLLIFIFIICSAPFLSYSQNDWRTMIGNPDIDFTTIQKSFYTEFGNQIGAKGTGWKQFKRWEYYHEQRLDSNGNFPAPGNVLSEVIKYRQTHDNLETYTLGSGNWQLLGPTPVPNNGTGQLNGNGRLTCITFHPNDANTIFVGAPSGGLWKTTDNGATWTQYATGLTRLGVSSIVVHPSSPNTIYIGTGDRDAGDAPGYGVWRTLDGGLTWASHNNGMGNRTINELIMDPNNSNIMVAAGSNGLIYRTVDGGAIWTQSASLGINPKDIAYHPTNSNIAYASGTELHKSTDGGASWTQITNGVPGGVQRIALAVSPNQPNWVYLLAGGGSGLVGIYRSTNSGTSFTTRTTTPNILGYETNGSGTASQAWYDLVIAADPTDANIIFTGGVNMWKSTDGGSNMSCVSYWVGVSGSVDGVHADQHVLEFSPYTNNIFSGNDGGIYESANGGTTWTDLSGGLSIAQVYKIGVSQQTQDKAINGYQDNGTGINTGTDFITEIGGDGMECIIDPTDDNFMYGALYYGNIRRSTNGGNTFGSISGPTGEAGGWVTPYKLDPNNANRMFAGYNDIWRNDAVRTGTAWTQISNFTNTSNMVDLAIAPSNSNVMYVSKGGGSNFYRTTNALAGSPTWTNLEASLPATGTPKDIEIDHTDPTHLFIALGNNIHESTNSGANWTNVSGSLPNISLNTIVIDKDSPIEAMYVGMDVGVYYKDNTMADWVLYSTGLLNIEVPELEIHYNATDCNSTLYAATYGQGLWKSDLKDPGNVAAVACFEASATDVCMGETVTFTDNSSYTPTSWTWTITPATVTFAGGTNANSQNPQINFTAAGTYSIQLQAFNATGNDIELKNTYITVSAASVGSAYTDDFESHALCGTTTDCATTTCAFTGTFWKNLTNGTEDDIDWRIDEEGTTSAGTGPSQDFNPGTAAGNYAYTEASNSCNSQTAILECSCMNLDQTYDFVFAYHMFGGNMGSLHLDINVGGTWTLDITPAIMGDQGNSWQIRTVSLAAYTGQIIKLRLRGVTGNGFESDIAIDDIALTPVSSLPITLLSFDAEVFDNKSVNLQWKTLTELNTDLYIIQRSSDAINWIGILEEDAEGNSNSLLTYTTWDRSPLKGVSYYRLKAVDINGAFNYSDIRQVSFTDVTTNIYPNPAKEYVIMEQQGIAKNEVTISNLMGQTMTTKNFVLGENRLRVDVSNLVNGLYIVRLRNLYGIEKTSKFTVYH